MSKRLNRAELGAALALSGICAGAGATAAVPSSGHATFAASAKFLAAHTDTLVLTAPDGVGKVLVAPKYQARVMTSSVAGDAGMSLGWINHDLIARGDRRPHINAYGGEERFWIGPEGGQFAVFFAPGLPFDFENWQTPPLLDTEPFDVVASTASRAEFSRVGRLVNRSGTRFDLRIDRTVEVLSRQRIGTLHGFAGAFASGDVGHLQMVGYESRNHLTNVGTAVWRKETGLLSIWLLGMYNASKASTIVIPYDRAGAVPPVNDAYFGKVSPERLQIGEKAVFFKADAGSRGKLGLPAAAARDVLGAFDGASGVLTVIQFEKTPHAADFVNSLWKTQDDPFRGDEVNAYNDGPPTPGAAQLGQFFELETSSPALELAPGASVEHIQRTLHFQGDRAMLDRLARHVLGVSLNDIDSAFQH